MTDSKEAAPQKQPPAPIIPFVQELQPQSRGGIPAEVSQVISSIEPEKALEYLDKWVALDYRDRADDRSQQLQLAQAQLALEDKKESNRLSASNADRDLLKSSLREDRNLLQGSLRWGLSIFLSVFVASLAFSYAVGDKEGKTPQMIVTLAAGVLGGTGLSSVRGKTSDKDSKSKKP